MTRITWSLGATHFFSAFFKALVLFSKLLILSLPQHLYSQPVKEIDLPAGVRLELVHTGQDVVWGIDSISESQVLFTGKSGTMGLLNLGKKKPELLRIDGVPELSTSGQGGLLDVRLSPMFQTDKRVFFTYSKRTEKGVTTALAGGVLNIGKRKLSDTRDLFIAKTDNGGSVHFGSRITFDQAGHLFFGIGDRGERERSQDLAWHNGKIIRLKLDGSTPRDNPFVGQKDALPEIYSYGHRNPQGLYYSGRLKKLFNSEHGPRGGDEINEVKAGKNYGWPVITFGREYYGPKIGVGTSHKGMEQPLKYFTPSIAPSSLIMYESERIPALTGKFVLGALALQHLNVVSQDGKTESRYLKKLEKRIRQVHETRLGTIFIGTDSGEIYRMFAGP